MKKLLLLILSVAMILPLCADSAQATVQLQQLYRSYANKEIDEVFYERLQELIAAGAAVNTKSAGGWTPLMYAVAGNKPKVIRRIIASGADLNAKSEDNLNYTALMLAAYYHYPEIVQILLEAGADPDMQNDDGQTVLDIIKREQKLGAFRDRQSRQQIQEIIYLLSSKKTKIL